MSLSAINTKIKQRATPKDVFITPLKLAKTAIDMIEYTELDVWYDPFKNSGSYYNQFPTDLKAWSEILEGQDFFEYKDEVGIICSNPPYSMLDKVIEHSIELKPHTINYLIGINNLTPKRIEKFNNNNYGLTKIHLCKVYDWFGMSIIAQFEKDYENVITFDRTVWR
tara:strand:+ start:40 stop:540 length:501 start_codon:yes stop_codon:yes gene_type:complete